MNVVTSSDEHASRARSLPRRKCTPLALGAATALGEHDEILRSWCKTGWSNALSRLNRVPPGVAVFGRASERITDADGCTPLPEDRHLGERVEVF